VLTITAVVGAAMMNCTDRLSCDKCQIHFCTTVPGEWSILISMQLFHLEQNVLSSPAAAHRHRSMQSITAFPRSKSSPICTGNLQISSSFAYDV